jgi:polar amino acid transport system substrate-binding protein
MRIPTATARTLGLLAGLSLAPQPALALKLLTEENPPLNYTEGKKLTGIATEVVQEMLKRAKMKPDIEVMSWDKAYEKAQADKETCLYATARLPNRENAFKWVGPIAMNKWGLYALGGFKPELKTIAEVRPFRVGGVERDAKVEFLRERGVTSVLEEKDDRQNPSKLTLNRKEPLKIDLWITSIASAKKVAAQAKVTDLKLVLVVNEADSYLACSPRTAPATLKALAAALDSLKKDGSYEKIVKAYENR